jgi:PST family polysaccharide transporter
MTFIATRFRPARPTGRLPGDGVLGFGANMSGYALTSFVSRNADSVLIAYSAGMVPLGYYDRAYKLLLTPLQSVQCRPVG